MRKKHDEHDQRQHVDIKKIMDWITVGKNFGKVKLFVE